MSDEEDQNRLIQVEEVDFRDPVAATQGSPEKLKWAHAVVRLILSRDMKGLSIRREHFNEANLDKGATRGTKFDEIFNIVQLEFLSIYGMKLVPLPLKEQVSSGNKRKKARVNAVSLLQKRPDSSFALKSVLLSDSRAILYDLWGKDVQELSEEERRYRQVSDRSFFRPFMARTLLPLSNTELVKNGILALVVGIVVFNENRVSENELLKTLASFGLTNVDSNTSISMTALELLVEFVKRDYLQKLVTGENRAPDYAMGPKLMVQMSANDMYRLVRGIFGESFDLEIQSRVQNSLQRVYKDTELVFDATFEGGQIGEVSETERDIEEEKEEEREEVADNET